MPPMMTITKASMIMVAAMPFEAVTSGAASTPPRPPARVDAEHARTDELDVDAERTGHVGVLRRGADQEPEPRSFENCQIATATTMPGGKARKSR